MKTIQIAPYKKDCRIVGRKVTGKMGGRKFVFELPESQFWMDEAYEDEIEYGADDCVVFVPEELYEQVKNK